VNVEAHERIVGYFIEEAKEHLETLEQGILDLAIAANDEERVNEMFRAAHSIKGGAAMLGYTSIQNTAHCLEDSFKFLRENELKVDQNLESLFFAGYDVLQDLIDRLQSPERLEDSEGLKIFQEAEPRFVQLQHYLDQILASGAGATPTTTAAQSLPEQVKQTLKEMLQLFKQQATPESRQKIQQLCHSLSYLAPEQSGWQKLVETAGLAVSNPKYTYSILAPVVIKEIKLGCDGLELDMAEDIAPSEGLQQLASSSLPQILVTLEPESAAKTLMSAFNKEQLSQLVQYMGAKI